MGPLPHRFLTISFVGLMAGAAAIAKGSLDNEGHGGALKPGHHAAGYHVLSHVTTPGGGKRLHATSDTKCNCQTVAACTTTTTTTNTDSPGVTTNTNTTTTIPCDKGSPCTMTKTTTVTPAVTTVTLTLSGHIPETGVMCTTTITETKTG